MPGIIRNVTKQFIISCNLFVSLCMLLLYVLPHTDQNYFWILNLLAMVFPFLLLLQLGFLIFWLIVKPKLSIIPVVTLVLCFGFIRSVFGFHQANPVTINKKEGFRMATWNVHLYNFYENNGTLDPGMLQYTRSLRADVLAVQEFVFSLDSNSSISLDNVRKRLGYKYVIAGNDRRFGVHTNAGARNEKYFPFCVALFSNYPILKWERKQSLREYNHTYLWADILVGNDTIRFFNVHLQSMHFVKKDYDFIENIDQQDMDGVKKAGRYLISKIKAANLLRAIQVEDVRDEVARSPHEVILCGDFNDVPNSYSYQAIADKLKDAHVKKGSGLGRTFRFLAPTLRIDNIFYSPSVTLERFGPMNTPLSDHLPLVAEFDLPRR